MTEKGETLIKLWFAFKLVSLSHWIQLQKTYNDSNNVVICFQISIFEPLNTAATRRGNYSAKLWFAFKLVSLSHWIQHMLKGAGEIQVVICFQISIFEPLNTAHGDVEEDIIRLWFAFKLVSLSHWIQPKLYNVTKRKCCDLLSN